MVKLKSVYRRITLKVTMFYRRMVHILIVRYIRSVGGVFHHGKDGRYVTMMSGEKYHEYKKL